MSDELYEVLALAMRYWFILLGVLIVLRAFAWQWHEHRVRHQRLKELPDAGMIGELVVLHGSEELPEGAVIDLPYEGVLGFVRTCDVVVPCNRIAAEHLDFSFQPGVGLLVYPRYRCACRVDGRKVTSRSKPRRHPLVQGSILRVGEAELQVSLFDSLAARLCPRPEPQMNSEAAPVPAEPMQAPLAKRVQTRQLNEPQAAQPTLFGQPVPRYDDAPERGDRHGP